MTKSPLVRLYCDFNDGDEESGYWILYHDGRPLEEGADKLGLGEGSPVLLYQDEDDFEVPATIRRGRAFFGTGDESWLAFPDWSKRVDLS
jgi:hypothetical protein